MPANPWELRADVRPLEAGAQRWTEVGALVSRRGDELVEAARRATEGWDTAAAESYEQHRKQVLAHLDRFTTLADQVADSLRAVAGVMASSQEELDRAWTTVAAVPHEVVGESRHLVFKPSEDEERGTVTRGQAEADDIRRRLTAALDQESTRLRSARAELVRVRTELTSLTGGGFPGFGGPGGEEPGVGTVAGASSTAVPGSAQAGVAGAAALPPLAPVTVSVPDLTGISAAAVAPVAAGATAGASDRRRGSRQAPLGTPPGSGTGGMGEMGAGAMAARAGTMSRGTASGRGAPARTPAPRLGTTAAEEAAARAAGEKEAAREAQRNAPRSARSSREAARRDDEPDDTDEHDRGDPGEVEELGAETEADGVPDKESGERRQAVRVVHEAAPGAGGGEPRR